MGKEIRRKRRHEESESEEDEESLDSGESEEEINEEKENAGPSKRRRTRPQLESTGLESDSEDDTPATFKDMWMSSNDSDDDLNESDLKVDDCVKIISGRFIGFYGIILPSSNDYAEKNEKKALPVIDIQYYKKQLGHYVVNEGDLDTRKVGEVRKVAF